MNFLDFENDARKILSQPVGEKTNWVVITGAPSAGKTTILQELSSLGFKTSYDVSREHLELLIANSNSNKYEIRQDEAMVQRDILWKMLIAENALPALETVILDYALPDNLIFWELGNIPLTGDVWRASVRFRYKHIFIFDSLPFVDDNVRAGSDAYQDQITEKQKIYYSALGYEWNRVPAATVFERTRLILDVLSTEV